MRESATVVGRGGIGYKAWKELQDYLELLNFSEVPDDHPRRPDEEGAQKGEEAKELLHPPAAAYDIYHRNQLDRKASNNKKRTAEQELDKQGEDMMDLATARVRRARRSRSGSSTAPLHLSTPAVQPGETLLTAH